MKKIRKISVWIGIITYLLVVLGFVNSKQGNCVCNKLDIVILDSLTNRFVTKKDISGLLSSSSLKILGYPVEEVNTNEIENVLNSFKSIKDAEAYLTMEGTLHILVNQRQPILRIMNSQNMGYYIDREGKIIPLSNHYSSFVLVANGYIIEPYKVTENISILEECDPGSRKGKQMLDLYEVAEYINENEFWNAQMEQIYVNRKGEFELIPRVGPHVIVLGSLDDYKEKFKKLKIFYDRGLSNMGWNTYEIINLKYKDQVVCTKR